MAADKDQKAERYRPPPAQSTWAALAAVLAGVLVAVAVNPAAGAWTLAGLCLAGAVARTFIPQSAPLAVRRRFVDVTLLVSFALALGFLAATTPLT